jgi:membrane protease subunit HflK
MNRRLSIFALLAAAYLASGLFIVRGNEQAVVRRFGRMIATPGGAPALRASGLNYDLPWPFSQVDRVNLNELRTLSIGLPAANDEEGKFLDSADAASESQFLTGDKNILHLQITVQYRIGGDGVGRFLFASESAEERLRLLAESTASDLVAQSGVDYVHPLGLSELREILTSRTRTAAEALGLGIEVEEVAVTAVSPPVQVKSYFLDVSNARADKEKFINAANAYAEQRLAAAGAEARKTLDQAAGDRQEAIAAARASAESFVKLVDQFRREEAEGVHTYAAARQMAVRRLYAESMEQVFRKLAGKVFVDSGKPADLTIFRDPKQ